MIKKSSCINILRIRGFTIIELLVSLLIATLIMGALINIYWGTKVTYNAQHDKLDAEIKQLQVKDILYDFVKDSGFACKFGHKGQNYYNITGSSLDTFFYDNYAVKVGSLPFAVSDALPSSMEDGCSGECFKAGADYILVKKEESHAKLQNITSLSSDLLIDQIDDVDTNDYVLLCNKESIDLATVTSAGSGILSLVQAPGNSVYYPGDYLGKYSFQVLYVRNTGDKDKNGQDIYSLYVFIKDSTSQGMSYELVRGIESLDVEYGSAVDGVTVWAPVETDVNIDNAVHTALRVSFTIDGQTYTKIITL